MQRMKLLILKYARSSLSEERGCGNGTERLHERELQKERGKLRQRERESRVKGRECPLGHIRAEDEVWLS